ncbi:uncharacterized protein HLK63_L09361 [Nakaseomyces glabratus]|nr:hypothetical protein B1J91_L05896g [Nakaseomyces glabratus]OXB46250.1 hypothetical protein B1J92_L05896g [Nakaseomyces glabratus]UCS22996.1 uncharacterized protein GW608_L09361 [Nakaseomyces glabratus]UCS28228.1 uncharacterized protein HLK63_L09361 [Nakaseomyces glabratus]UCS33457.1 uncharacterized protein HLK64_L09361 [Nakaseomyces glabratus]
MSLHDYLLKEYGPSDRKKKSKKVDSKSTAQKPSNEDVNSNANNPLRNNSEKSLWLSHGVKNIPGAPLSDNLTNKQKNGINIEPPSKTVLEPKTHNIETVFRNAQGHKIDVEAKTLDSDSGKRNSQEERIRILNMGEIQLAGLDGVSTISSKYTAEIRDNDPATEFDHNKGVNHQKISPLGRKLYAGTATENRFGILPGNKWDGVDRSNGYEKKWFKRQGELAESKIQEFTNSEDY